MAFPNDFLWGTATSSYQIEGAALEDGRGECIWTRFSHTPGRVLNGDTGDVACDHYHRYRDDIALMKELGMKAYRFSVAWPRIIPAGVGALNPAGLDFYSRLVDALLEAGIVPFLTLYHWDLPQTLQDRGGWTNPDIVGWFADYAGVVAARLGDRVAHWVTINEPWCVAHLGYREGEHAPGVQDHPSAFRAAHHTLLAHGAAVPVIRGHVPRGQVGITLNIWPHVPASEEPLDHDLARMGDAEVNRWFLDPLYRGTYPDDLRAIIERDMPEVDLSGIEKAAVPTDFLGVNYYNRTLYSAVGEPPFPPDAEFTEMGWEVYPPGLTDILLRVHRDYAPSAMYVTENGAAFADPDPVNGAVADPRRVAYLREHFAAAEAAIAQGVPLKGYFVWSLLDNFEWAWGYTRRFGIVHVDFATQKRTLKDSARYYQQVIRANAV